MYWEILSVAHFWYYLLRAVQNYSTSAQFIRSAKDSISNAHTKVSLGIAKVSVSFKQVLQCKSKQLLTLPLLINQAFDYC